MNDKELDKKVLGSSNALPELNEQDQKFINDLDKMKTESQFETENYLNEAGLQPESEKITREERKEEDAKGTEQKDPAHTPAVNGDPSQEGSNGEQEFDWTGYEEKAKGRFTESEEFEDKKQRINIQKNIGFERINEGFMKVSYVGPDKQGNAKIMYLYGYGSLQSSILYIHSVYSTGHIPVGYHTLDLKNGYSVEWYSYSRYITEARQIELELEKWEESQTAEAKEKRRKEMQEEEYKQLERQLIEKKAQQYEELKSKKFVKFLKLVKLIK